MKKLIFSICLVTLAVGCTKTESRYEQAGAISFAPVAYNQTKAALAKDAVPTANLIVSANAGSADAAASSYSELYFNNVEFVKGTDNIFTAEGYFWPNVKYLTFAGITKSAGVDVSKVTMDVDANSIIIAEYPQQQVNVQENDLMWFGQTTPAGKQDAAVPVTMQHACSWIVLNIKGDATAGSQTLPWEITDITINGLSDKETATLTGTASWTETGSKNTSLKVYSGTKGSAQKLSSTVAFTPSEAGIIVIPQKPSTLSITYNYVSQKGASDAQNIVIEETATVELDYDSDKTNWQPGTKYTYDITIGTSPIKIAPKAGEWTTGTTTSPTI